VHTAYCADSTSALSASDGSVGVSSTALSWRLRGKWSAWNSSLKNTDTLVASRSPVITTCALLCVLAGTNDRLYGALCSGRHPCQLLLSTLGGETGQWGGEGCRKSVLSETSCVSADCRRGEVRCVAQGGAVPAARGCAAIL
jgi:hypothetical protein